MAENNTILVVAVLAVIASLAAAGFSYYSLSNGGVSGFASNTDSGTAQLSVTDVVEIEFTDSLIDWGAGRVDTNKTSATLDTAAGTVVQGSWTPETTGLTLENKGNVQVNVTLSSAKVASVFIGGSSPSFKLKATSANCAATPLSSYTEVGAGATPICGGFNFVTGSNTLKVDAQVVVPKDAVVGAKTDTLTAVATAA
jgi:hypothetical protein